jgi:transposase-like protein
MQMGKQRQKHSDSFKAKVALDAIRGMKTLAQLSSEYQVHQSQICAWKKLLLSNAVDLFSSGKSGSGKSEEELTAPLYEQIGRLQMDLNWLKKKL